MNVFATLSGADLKQIRRDELLQFFLIYPLLLGVLLRWLIPWATERAAGFLDLTPYYVLLVSFFGLLVIPQLVGLLVGTLLLDERDEHTLTALMVTPMPMQSYALYRVLTPVLINLVGGVVVIYLIGIAVPTVEQTLILLISVAPMGPVIALLLASLAKNKVEGIAIMKALGIFTLVPFAAWFVPEPWQWLLGIFPTYWSMKAYWLALAGEAYLWVAGVGLLYGLGLLWLLIRRFQVNLYR